MHSSRGKRRAAFSLLELVIVVVIVAVIAAIAIPRMARGTSNAAESALQQDLSVLRNAIDTYAVEHNDNFPDEDKITDQLTMYSDAFGNTNAEKDSTYIYGPYIRKIPPLPVGDRAGNSGIAASHGDGVGWIYGKSDRHIRANTKDDEQDAAGTKYKDY